MTAAKELWKSPSEDNWKAFRSSLNKSSIVYYRIVFANGGRLSKAQDLTKSFAELYDAEYKLVAEVPIFERRGIKVRGATIYLTGLQVRH